MIVNADFGFAAAHAAMPSIGGVLAADSATWDVLHTGGGNHAWSRECDDGAARVLISYDGTLGYPDSPELHVWLERWIDGRDEGETTASFATMAECVAWAHLACAARAFAIGFQPDAPMTLREFVASKVYYPDFSKSPFHGDEEGAGWVYNGGPYINQSADGSYSLIIERSEWNSADISELEPHLYRWAYAEGRLEEARHPPAKTDSVPTLAQLEKLAADARPINDEDWGSTRQVDAENLFFDEAAKVAPQLDSDSGSEFAAFCLKATTDEYIDAALAILRDEMNDCAAPLHPGFRVAFPDFPASDFPAIPEGWRDASWRNDVCPSLYTHNNLQVFIECAAPADREFPECARYSVNLLDQYGYDGDDAVFASEDWQAVLAFVSSFETPAPTGDQLDALVKLATERGNSEAIEAEMSAALETYCKVEGLPLMSADELRAELIGDNPEAANRAHVSYLTAFCAQWDAVASVTDAKHRAKAEAPAPMSPADELAAVKAELAAQYVKRIGYDPFEDCPTISPAEVARTLIEHGDENGKAALDCVAEALTAARRNAFPG